MGACQPYLYSPASRDSRFPAVTFDPKAVTRASWEPKPRKSQPKGPLISLNQHPDSHFTDSRHPYQGPLLGSRTKRWIHIIRKLQLALRILQLNGAAAILALMILTVNIELVPAWIVRIASGVSMIHCIYAIYHLSGNATSRTPGSTAAYQVFAVTADLLIVGVSTFGVFTTQQQGRTWGTRLNDQGLMRHFVPAIYYTLIGTGASHLMSLVASLWLGLVFRRISLMPPDMNPLEDHLTARPFSHKRNKASITTASSIEYEKRRPTTSLQDDGNSEQTQYEPFRPSLVPFLHTRASSTYSGSSWLLQSSGVNGQYYSVPASSSCDRQSFADSSTHVATHDSTQSRSYLRLPLEDFEGGDSEDNFNDYKRPRLAKFTETWQPTDSLISRTKHRAEAKIPALDGSQIFDDRRYSALPRSCDVPFSPKPEADYFPEAKLYSMSSNVHPNPLRSNPARSSKDSQDLDVRKLGALRSDKRNPKRYALSDTSGNRRQSSLSRDIADELLQQSAMQRRKGSVQADDGISASLPRDSAYIPRPLSIGSSRKISSGNDYGANHCSLTYGRRVVSGRQAEEGQAGTKVH